MNGIKRYIKQHMEETPGTNLHQLKDKVPVNSKTGYRNISTVIRSGTKFYRVAIQFKGKQHSQNVRTLAEDLKVREALRQKYWPNYKK
ncbi:hypothetical protein LBSG162_06810 [Lentilactobacillus buchneri subsp. silagei]|nr:hypothetical protein LBSG162_06810 [Lentilactobacillus buchneri subsp. silagei]